MLARSQGLPNRSPSETPVKSFAVLSMDSSMPIEFSMGLRGGQLARSEPLLARSRHAVGRRTGPACDDLAQLVADEVEPHAVVGREPFREAAVDELAVARAAALLAVVVRARAAGNEPEPVLHALELRAERVGHARLEPADHPGARA